MSVRIMADIWQRSRHKGTSLLLMLAIGDCANDEGIAWPALETLARKIRMSERYTHMLISVLLESKELKADIGGGKRNTNIYSFELPPPRPQKQKGEAGLTLSKNQRVRRVSVKRASERVRPASAKGEARLTRTIINHQEPPEAPTAPPPPTTPKRELAAVVGGRWVLSGLLEAGKINPRAARELVGGDIPAPAFVALYLYGMCAAKIHSPALWAAKRVIEQPHAGRPFDQISNDPAMLNDIFDWLESGQPYAENLNGLMADALAFRGHLIGSSDWPARIAKARVDLGLPMPTPRDTAAAASETQIQREAAPDLDAWQTVIEQIAVSGNKPGLDRLRRCKLVEVQGDVLTLAAPTQADVDWLTHSMMREISRFAKVQFIVSQKGKKGR